MSTIQAETRPAMMLNPVVRAMAFWIGSAILAITIFAPGFYKDLGEFAFFVGPADGDSWRWAARGLVAGVVLGIGQHLAGMGRPGQDEIRGTLPTGDSRRWAGMEMSARWVLGIGRYSGGAGRQGWGWIWGTLVGAGIGGAFSGPLCFYLYWSLARLLPLVGWDPTTIPPTTGIGQWAWIPGMAV